MEQAQPRQKALDPEQSLRASATGQERTNLPVFEHAGGWLLWRRRFGVAPPCDTCPLSKLYGCLKTNKQNDKRTSSWHVLGLNVPVFAGERTQGPRRQ